MKWLKQLVKNDGRPERRGDFALNTAGLGLLVILAGCGLALLLAISKHELSMFLERGEDIEKEIRADVDQKTTDWGITVQHIEITDIQIPDALQDSLSRLAQMEREKKGRILLAEAEIEIAKKLEEAAGIYDRNATAMKLKSLSILNETKRAADGKENDDDRR